MGWGRTFATELTIMGCTFNRDYYFKAFGYSFLEVIPIFFNRLKSVFFLVRSLYKPFTSNWLWIEMCGNVVLSRIYITMTTINKKL